MKSKIPKELLTLLIKRRDIAEKLLHIDSEVEKMLEEINLIDTQEYATLQNDYGCCIYTEPQAYYEKTIIYIKNQLKKE